ncbi:MAG: TadE family type IV pilus minor pilin [Aeromicrobium sp.]
MKRDERGMVTAELAVIAPFGVAFAFLLLWVVSLGVTQVRIVDASREAARMVARGDSVAEATTAARHNAPEGARIEAKSSKGLVTVTVSAKSAVPLPFFSGVGARTMTATAVAAAESP